MAKLPQTQRLAAEEFKDQLSWIGRLIAPLNQFMEQVYAALNRGLTIDENTAGAIKVVTLDGNYPIKLAWDRPQRPKAVIVGDWNRVQGSVMLNTNGRLNLGENLMYDVPSADVEQVQAGWKVSGTGIPDNTYVVFTSGSDSLGLSRNATATTSAGTDYSLSIASTPQVIWHFNQAGQLQIDAVFGIAPSPTDKYTITLVCLA